MARVVAAGERYLPVNFEGEAIITIGRTVAFAEQGAGLVVNCAPFGCMPGTLTTAIFQEVRDEIGIPVVSMFYDGEGDQNRRLEVFLANLTRRPEAEPTAEKRPAVPARRRPPSRPTPQANA